MAESVARAQIVSPLIEMSGLVRVYRMGDHEVRAVDDVWLVVDRGEFVAVMGASGSGKSTLLNLMGCLDTPSQGHYVLHGQTVSSMDDDALADARNREIGFVFQTFNLLKRLTAMQNVELPLVYARVAPQERSRAAREMLALADRADHRSNQLSGGQRQRVAIARALVHRPALLLADEPTGNLDSESSEEIMKLFAELHAQGNTIVMVTHDKEIATFAERTIRMHDGKIVQDTRV